MGSNSFGKIFRVTTWGESHGKAIGVVVDGCPANLPVSEEEIQKELARRRPGGNPYTSPRAEKDSVQVLSGLFEGKTTGAPISMLICNQAFDSAPYEQNKDRLRPGHANYTYLEKYGTFDYRGGGRASGRETACRVAAGAIAKTFLRSCQIEVVAYVKEAGGVMAQFNVDDLNALRQAVDKSAIYCPDPLAEQNIKEAVAEATTQGDSLGGIIECVCQGLPAGLGDPVYEKLEANLAHAMMSIPAAKGFEVGSGFQGARMKGSEHNDPFTLGEKDQVITTSNHAGGTLGGISTGMPLIMRVAFKPTASIRKKQQTLDLNHKAQIFEIPEGSKHDPCIAFRAVAVVEAMTALVLADAVLLNRCARL